jgi:hypothetical protein
MPPRGVTSAKRKRQYEHVKDSELERGVGEDRAEEIAARTVNKQRAQAGETKGARGGRKTAGKKGGAKKGSGGTKSSRRTAAPARGRKASDKKR